jgi:hypothetical protein
MPDSDRIRVCLPLAPEQPEDAGLGWIMEVIQGAIASIGHLVKRKQEKKTLKQLDAQIAANTAQMQAIAQQAASAPPIPPGALAPFVPPAGASMMPVLLVGGAVLAVVLLSGKKRGRRA